MRRWNGAYLEGFSPGIDDYGYIGLEWQLRSFESCFKASELRAGVQEGGSDNDYFRVFVDNSGNMLGFRNNTGGPELYDVPHDTPEVTLAYCSIAAAIDTFAVAIEAGLTFSGDDREWMQEKIEYAQIAKRFNPGINEWDEEIAYWTEELKNAR